MMMMAVMLQTVLDLSIEEINVIGGQEYLIEWDDRWEDTNPFDWELIFTPLPACPEPLDVAISTKCF